MKLAKGLGLIFTVLVLLLGGTFFAIKSMKLPDVPIENVNLENVRDGSYLGEYTAGPVKAVVKVDVQANQIERIIIQQHQCGLGRKAEKIVDRILKKQTLYVDAISGATLSSKVILKAVQEGLEKGTDFEDRSMP